MTVKGAFGNPKYLNRDNAVYNRLVQKAKDFAAEVSSALDGIQGPALLQITVKLDEVMFWLNRGIQQKNHQANLEKGGDKSE